MRRRRIVALAGPAGLLLVLLRPVGVAACVGGGIHSLDGAVAAAGAISEALVVEAVDTQGRGIAVRLVDVSVVRGDPPLPDRAHLTALGACDQSIDTGERVWLLYELKGYTIPSGLTAAFVIEGSDGVGRARASRALDGLPATDTVPQAAANEHATAAWPFLTWLVAAIVVLRHTRARAAPP